MWFPKLQHYLSALHAKLCYHFFITPIPFGIEKHYREFADMAHEFFLEKRTELIVRKSPRHHVLHHFAQPAIGNGKKILVTHGWMSQSAFMVKLIRTLHQEGYDVYALDFPAHGRAKGLQLPWDEAVMVLKNVLNEAGPFYAALGHSFGGSMLLHTLNLTSVSPEWALTHQPEKIVMISSPVRMRVPVGKIARFLRLNGASYRQLRHIFRQKSPTDLTHLNFKRLAKHANFPLLCIHGSEDHYIPPMESKLLFKSYPYAELMIIPGLDHVEVLIDPRVEKAVSQFLAADHVTTHQD